MPRLYDVYPGIYLTTEEKAWKNLSQGTRRMPVGKEYTEQNMLNLFCLFERNKNVWWDGLIVLSRLTLVTDCSE